jgi:hypothetical protein
MIMRQRMQCSKRNLWIFVCSWKVMQCSKWNTWVFVCSWKVMQCSKRNLWIFVCSWKVMQCSKRNLWVFVCLWKVMQCSKRNLWIFVCSWKVTMYLKICCICRVVRVRVGCSPCPMQSHRWMPLFVYIVWLQANSILLCESAGRRSGQKCVIL